MTSYELALLLHLTGAIGFFAGIALAGAAQLAAWQRERAGEIAAVLALARTGVLLVAAGTVVVLVTGLWLIDETRRSLGDGWIAASLGLLVVAAIFGAAGGRKAKQARLLAESQAPEVAADPQVRLLLRDRAALAANACATAASFAVLVLMVIRPGQ